MMAQQENKLPQHVAIIMDGNGRWGEHRGKPRWEGHKAGADNVRSVVLYAGESHLPTLTLWGFSTDNWKRPDYEIKVLMRLFRQYILREADELDQMEVRVTFTGRRYDLEEHLQRIMRQLEERTADNSGLWLRIAINYSGTQSQRDAYERLKSRGEKITEENIRVEMLEGAPPYDLVIRTGAELRLSDFPAGHAELNFSNKLWPDFTAEDLDAAISSFGSRQRRFGGVKEA